jgi:hypothetical protein
MGKIKEYYHDEIEKASREADDYDYQYQKWVDMELEKQRKFENYLNNYFSWRRQITRQFVAWTKQTLNRWRSLFTSTTINFWKKKNLF